MKDTQGNILHAHGGGIIKVGDYFIGTVKTVMTTRYLKVCAYIARARWAIWEFVKDILTDRSDADLNSAKIERPKIIYNSRTKNMLCGCIKKVRIIMAKRVQPLP